MPIDREALIEAARNHFVARQFTPITRKQSDLFLDAILPILAADEQAIRADERRKVLRRIANNARSLSLDYDFIEPLEHEIDALDAATTPAGRGTVEEGES